jgi:hypothetical protein
MIYGSDTPLYLRLFLTLKSKFPILFSPVGASPDGTDSMVFDDAKKYIDGVLKAQQIAIVEITGGEPFLHYDEMVKTLHYAKSKGLQGKVTTSAFWATDMAKSNWIIQQLKDAGAERIEIRFDAMYNEFVPLERVKNAAISARQKGLVVQIIAYYIFPISDLFTDKGPYTGETTNDTDKKTLELQNSLLEYLPKRCIEWERVRITPSNTELQKLLGDKFSEALAASDKAFASSTNQNGKINSSVTADVFPTGETIINGHRIGNAREKEIDLIVRDFLIESRLAF